VLVFAVEALPAWEERLAAEGTAVDDRTAYTLYLRDPDGHRVEIYTQDYYTGDPDNPVVTWDVHDNQRRDWWGNPVVPSWYTEASLVLDLDGEPMPVAERDEPSEAEVTIGADGFSYTRKGDNQAGFKLGSQL
jgi:hypothetical protein